MASGYLCLVVLVHEWGLAGGPTAEPAAALHHQVAELVQHGLGEHLRARRDTAVTLEGDLQVNIFSTENKITSTVFLLHCE